MRLPILLAVCLLATNALADPISAERPGFASGPVPLADGVNQLELGYQANDSDSFDVHTLPLLLYRRGIGDNLELQIGWAGYNEIELPAGGDIDGFSDMSIGVKSQFDAGNDGPADIGWFAGVSLPLGSNEFSSDAIDPTVGIFWTHAADNQLPLFGTILLSSTTVVGDRTLAGGVSAGTSFSLDEKRGLYVELFTLFSEGSGPAHTINGGLTYLVNNDMQLDIEAGFGLNDRADDFFFGMGLAKRWQP
ncbi:MAG: transporter [Gammaproteobacteria bacterium]|nr:transporter [Gammaproteobacteria bacterium]